LPFSYARRTGVLLGKDQDNWTVYYRGELDVDALLEVRRIAGHGFALEQLLMISLSYYSKLHTSEIVLKHSK